MRVHELKTWPEFFEPIYRGDKRHEVRNNDREFKRGDVLHLREFYPESQAYTGREMLVVVSHITDTKALQRLGASFGQGDRLCVMSVRPIYDNVLGEG